MSATGCIIARKSAKVPGKVSDYVWLGSGKPELGRTGDGQDLDMENFRVDSRFLAGTARNLNGRNQKQARPQFWAPQVAQIPGGLDE